MSLGSFRTALMLIESEIEYEALLMATMMAAREDDGAALAGFYPLTAEEITARAAAPGGRLPDDPQETSTGE